MLKKIICSLLILLLCGCTNYIVKEENDIELIIDKININNEVSISSISNEVNGIVLFSEYGRPDDNTSTIIGAHSGYGVNAYFNDLSELEVNDKIKLKYYGKFYTYEVINVYEVNEADISVLENNEHALTLMTCKIDDASKRIIVIAIPT